MGPKRFLPERKSYSGLEKFVAGRGINWDEWDEDKHAQEIETEFHRILHVVKFPEAAEDEAAVAADIKRVWQAHAGGFAWPNSNASWEKKVLLVDLWNRLAADFCRHDGGRPGALDAGTRRGRHALDGAGHLRAAAAAVRAAAAAAATAATSTTGSRG